MLAAIGMLQQADCWPVATWPFSATETNAAQPA